MEKDKKRKTKRNIMIAVGIIGVAAAGILIYRNRSKICNSLANFKKPSNASWTSNPEIILSDEIPVDQEIVSNLTEAANDISNSFYKKTNGKVKLKTTVISNMSSHPTSGELQIDLSNVPHQFWYSLKSIAEEKMQMTGEINGDILEFS